jgi:hypothetical protein
VRARIPHPVAERRKHCDEAEAEGADQKLLAQGVHLDEPAEDA